MRVFGKVFALRRALGVGLVAGVAAGLSWVLFSGCDGLRAPVPPVVSYPPGQGPVFLLKYYPYQSGGGGAIAQPVPNYVGWTGERMGRDLRRLAGIGVDGVLVVITPELVGDSFQLERLAEFIRVAARLPGEKRVGVAFFLESDSGSEALFQRDVIGQWFVSSGVRDMPAVYRLGERPLVVVGPGVRLEGANHPAVHFLYTTGDNANSWVWPEPESSRRWALGQPGGQTVVRPGYLGGGAAADGKTWLLPRERGRTLQAQLWRAFGLRAQVICLSAWNDFRTGEFIEPNSLDGDAAYRILAEEIARVRQAAVGTPPGES